MVLSIWMITYNQEKFIRKAIESILMQKTNFDFELVIGEDCSTDATREICLEYKNKFPDKIKLLLPEKNLGMIHNFISTLEACNGKYIALCEGDDYWTDIHKLQTQVEFLETNPEYVLSFHNVFNLNEANQSKDRFIQKKIPSNLNTEYLIENEWTVPTCSMVFRNTNEALPEWFKKIKHSDYTLQLILSNYGLFHYHDAIMGTYRIHSAGISNQFHSERNLGVIKILNFFNTETQFRHKFVIKKRISNLYLEQALIEKHFSKPYKKYLLKSIKYYPNNLFFKLKKILRIIIPHRIKKYLKQGKYKTYIGK